MCLKFIQIVILWVYYTIPFGFTLFWHFWAYIFNFLNYFLWLRITDEGSVPEMRIWSTLLIKSDLKWCIHLSRSLFFNFYLYPCDLELWSSNPKMYTALLQSLSTNKPNLRQIGWKTAEKWWNTSWTNFQRSSPRDLGLCSMTMQMHRETVSTNVYTSAKFHQDRMKNDREIATSGFNYFVSLWPWPLTFTHQKVYSSFTGHCFLPGTWERSDNK